MIFNANPPVFPGSPPILPNAQATQREIDEFHADHKLWANAAQNFANFFEICFLPHEHLYGELQPTVPITWETFCEKFSKMETSNLMIDKLRLDAMFTFIYGFCSNHRKKTLFSNYWHQNTTQWSTTERQEAKKVFAALGARNQRLFDEDAAEDLIHGKLTQEFFHLAK